LISKEIKILGIGVRTDIAWEATPNWMSPDTDFLRSIQEPEGLVQALWVRNGRF
jgi:hypothetical protein